MKLFSTLCLSVLVQAGTGTKHTSVFESAARHTAKPVSPTADVCISSGSTETISYLVRSECHTVL